MYRERIKDSNHPDAHIDSPVDSDVWKEGVSLPKRYVEFQEKIFYNYDNNWLW